MNITTIQFGKLFPTRIKCDSPEIVFVTSNKCGNPAYQEKVIHGRFFRVSPQCSKEVFALQMLENQHDKFPPAKGDGVIVSAEALAKLDAKYSI